MGIRNDCAIWEAESEGLELIDLTIGDLLDQQVTSRPDYEAVVYHYSDALSPGFRSLPSAR
jgi:fatty-acyl-CoA synthase